MVVTGMMNLPSKRCAAERCPRMASHGSRCAFHWYRRTSAGKELLRYKLWRERYEYSFAEGLEGRRLMIEMGEAIGAPTSHYPPRYREAWSKLTNQIVSMSDKRSHDEHHRSRQEA